MCKFKVIPWKNVFVTIFQFTSHHWIWDCPSPLTWYVLCYFVLLLLSKIKITKLDYFVFGRGGLGLECAVRTFAEGVSQMRAGYGGPQWEKTFYFDYTCPIFKISRIREMPCSLLTLSFVTRTQHDLRCKNFRFCVSQCFIPTSPFSFIPPSLNRRNVFSIKPTAFLLWSCSFPMRKIF